ncbi:hypothetical protein IJH16_01345 [Candidatus Saccharibacteria bacterium]|nr:hypothetical protein [Candidatus Saccharibacteria bacterium]
MDINKWRDWKEKLPPMDKARHFDYYVESAPIMDAKKLKRDLIESLHGETLTEYQNNPEVRAHIEAVIDKFINIAMTSKVLYGTIYDTDLKSWEVIDPDGKIPPNRRWRIASEFFVPWIAESVPRSIALEIVYGYGVDITGKYRKMGLEDPFFPYAIKDDLFTGIMERGLFTVDRIIEEKPEKIGFLAAGMAPEFRHLGLALDSGQTAFLVDSDKSIDTEKLLQDLPFKDQIEYLQDDLVIGLRDPRMYQTNVLVANGIISYIWDKFPQILEAIKRVVTPGGLFIMELYPIFWEWERNRAIRGFYLPLTLFKSIEDANEQLFGILKAAGIDTNLTTYKITKDDFDTPIMVTYGIRMPK